MMISAGLTLWAEGRSSIGLRFWGSPECASGLEKVRDLGYARIQIARNSRKRGLQNAPKSVEPRRLECAGPRNAFPRFMPPARMDIVVVNPLSAIHKHLHSKSQSLLVITL